MECIQNLSQPKHGMALGRGETGAMKVSYVTLASYSYLDARCEEPQNLILPILFPTGRRDEYALRRTCTLNGSRTSPGYGKTVRMAGTGQGGRFSLSGRHSGAVQSTY